jgi:hypothetical protein
MISGQTNRLIFCLYPRIVGRKYVQRVGYNFCQLPKPSRFSQELGLQNEFQTVTNKMKKY